MKRKESDDDKVGNGKRRKGKDGDLANKDVIILKEWRPKIVELTENQLSALMKLDKYIEISPQNVPLSLQ